MELLIPILNKSIWHQFFIWHQLPILLEEEIQEKLSQNNQCTWCLPLKYGEISYKKAFHEGKGREHFWSKNLLGGCS